MRALVPVIIPNLMLAVPAALTFLMLASISQYALSLDQTSLELAMTILSQKLGSLEIWWVIFAAAGLCVIAGFYCAWVAHTRYFRLRAILIALLLLPATLPYDCVAWAVRNFVDVPSVQAVATLTARYMPVAFVFSYLTLSQWSNRIVRELGNLGLTEASVLLRAVLPRLPLPMLAQAVFLIVLMSLDAVGLAFPSGGRFASLGNSIDDWSRTIENQNLAYAITLLTVLVTAGALACINLFGWWRQTIDRQRSALDRSSALDVHVWLFTLISLLIASFLVVPPILMEADIARGLAELGGGIGQYGIYTFQYLLTGGLLTAVSACAIYSLMQARVSLGRAPITLVLIAVSFAAMMVPPVMRGDAFLRPMQWLSMGGGNASLVAICSWLATFPVTAIIASLHPASRSNRFQDMLRNINLGGAHRILLTVRHSAPVMLVAVGTWAFLTLFDTSIARELAGFDKPIAVWLSDRIVTASDRDVLSAVIAIWTVLTVGSVALGVLLERTRGWRTR